MPKWDEITRTEKYQNLPPEAQAQVKTEWFKANLLPEIENRPSLKEMGPDKVYEWFMQQPDDTGQGYVTSLLGSAARGFGEVVPGAVEGVGAITGIEGLREAGQGIRSGLESITPVNPLYQQEVPMQLAGVGGQIGSVLATGGVGGALGKALGGVNAVSRGAQGALLGSAFLQGAAEGRREAEQYGMEGPEAYLRGLTGGAIEAGTEFLPFGMAAETALAKRMLAGAPKTSSFLGAAGSEFGEEGLGKIASNIATQTLAPAGVEAPGIMEGALENALYGAAGGAMLGGINALIPSAPKSPEIQIAAEALNATTDTPFTNISGQAAADTIAQNTELAMRMPVQPVEAAEEIAPEVTPLSEGAAVPIAESPSPNLPPRATENVEPIPTRKEGESRQDFLDRKGAWDSQYGLDRKGGRTHNNDGTPYQPTVFDEVMPNILAAKSQMTEDEAMERIGGWFETTIATSVRTLLNAGWTWDAKNQRWQQPENNPVPNESPFNAILRLQGETQNVSPSTASTATQVAPTPAPKQSAAEKLLGLPAGTLTPPETPSLPETGPPVVDKEAHAGTPVQATPIQPENLQSALDAHTSGPKTPEQDWQFASSMPEGVWIEDGMGARMRKKSQRIKKSGSEEIEFEHQVFNEETGKWEDNPSAYAFMSKKKDGSLAVNNQFPSPLRPASYTEISTGERKISKPIVVLPSPQPVETPEDAAPEIPLEESVRKEPPDRVESREAEEAGAGDQLLRPAEGEVEEKIAPLEKNSPLPSPDQLGQMLNFEEVVRNFGYMWDDQGGGITNAQREHNAKLQKTWSDALRNRWDTKRDIPESDLEKLRSFGWANKAISELRHPLNKPFRPVTTNISATDFDAKLRELGVPKKERDKILQTTPGREFSYNVPAGRGTGRAMSGRTGYAYERDAANQELQKAWSKKSPLANAEKPTPATEGMVTPGGVATEREIETGAPKLDSQNDYFANNLASRAWRIAAGMQWDDNVGDWVHPDYPGRSRSVVEAEIAESNPPKKAEVQRVFNELAKSYGRDDLIKGEKTKEQDSQDFIQVGRFVKVGYRVPIYEKGEVVGGKTNKVVGKITRIMPDGKVEVRLNQGGFKVLPPSEIEDAPTHVGNKPLSTQTTAAETQTPESVAVDSGAAGVVQSEPSRGSILEVEKESTKTAIESTGKSAPSGYGEVVRAARKSLKERPADFKTQEQVLSDLMKLPVADLQSAFEVVTGSPTKLANKRQLANNVLNELLAEAQESKPTAAEDTFRKAEREAEEEIQRQNAQSISNLFDKLRTNPQRGQVTRADVNQAIGALQNSGEVPNAIFTWNGTTDDLLRQRATMERQFPGAVAAASMPNVEGVFENGMAFVFSNRIVVTDLDRRKAAEEGISPSVAAVKRVVTHENMHKGLWLLSRKLRRAIMRFLRQMFPAAELDELAKSYRQYADWRTNPVHEMALLDERLQKYIEETKTIPTDGVWKQFWDYIKEIWRKLTGKPKGEPTLQSMKDVVRLIRSALKNAHKARPDRTIDGGRVLMSVSGGRSFVPAVNIDGRVEIGVSHYDAWIKHALRQIPNFKKDGLSDEERRQLADRWIVDHPEFMAYSLRKEGFVSDGEFLNRQDSLKKFKSLGGVQQMAPGEPDRDWLDASDVEGYRFSYASEQDEASSIGQQTARYAASSPRTIEAIAGVRQAYAAMPKSNGAAAMLDDLFAETTKLVPNLTRPEFDRVIQGMYDDNAALLNDAQNPSSVTILPGAMMSMAGGANDAEYLAAVEAGDMDKAQRMVDEAAKAAINSVEANDLDEEWTPQAGEEVERVIFGDVPDVLNANSLSVIDLSGPEGVFGLHAGDPSFWKDKLVGDYGYDPSDAKIIFLTVAESDRIVEDHQYKIPEESGEKGSSFIVLTARKILRKGIDYRVANEDYQTDDIPKSADPVTYDDAGNIVPLSQRFQSASPDIRFSIASTPEQQSAAAKFKSAITAAAKGLPDLREYEGRLAKAASGEAIDVEPHNVLWFDGFMKASEQLLSDLQKQGLSLQQIYDKVAMDAEFKRELGLFDEETGSGQAATVLSGLLLQRTLNAARKARTAEAKAQGDTLHRKAAAYYSALATARGQNLLMYRLLQNDPRTRFAFMEDKVASEMLKKAEHGVNVQFGDGYAATQKAVNDAVDASAEAAKTEVADAVDNAAEEDQDAIDLAEGEATLDAKGKTLWEKFKDLIRKRGIAVRALNAIRAAKNARQSIAKSERDSIAQMSEEELVKFIAGLDSEMETVFGQFVGGTDETTRKKREKMVKTAKKRAAYELLSGPDAFKKMAREVNAMRPSAEVPFMKRIPWREIFRQPGKTVEEYRQNIFNAVNSNEAFKDLDEAQKRRLSELFAEAWQAQRDKILASMIEQHTYSLERQQKKEAAKALRDARNQIIEAVNLGAFSNDELTRVLGEKFGFKTSFTEDEKQKLSDLAEKLQDEKMNKAKRNKLAREFLSTLQSGTQIPIAELLSNWWVSAVLSGDNTVSAIALSFLNGTGIGIMGTHLSRALRELMKGNTANAIDAITSLFKAYAKHISSFPSAANRAWQYLWSGDVSFLESAANDPFGRVNTLADIAKYQVVADQVAKDPNKVKAVMGRFMQFMGRLLTALDAFNVMVTKAGTVSLAIRQSGLTPEQIRDAELKNDLKFYKDKIVREDPHFGGKQPTSAKEKAYLSSLAEAEMYADLAEMGVKMENADYLASESAMTMNPTGFGGIVYNSIKALDTKVTSETEKHLDMAQVAWAKSKNAEDAIKLFTWSLVHFFAKQGLNVFGLRFARFAGNKFNQSLSFVPGLGLLRMIEADNKELAGRQEAFKDTIIRNQTLGWIIMFAGWAIIKAIEEEPDDEKRGWFINGGWNNLTPDQKKQKISRGEKQYTIGTGDYVFNYQNWPISQPLAALGALSDLVRFSQDKWKEKTTGGKAGSAVISGMQAALEIPALTQVNEIFANTMASKDPAEQTASRLSRVTAGWMGGFMPRILKDLDYIQDPTMRRYGTLFQKAASHVPVYRRYVGSDYYDILGNKIEKNAIPGSRDFMKLEDKPEYRMLGALNARGIWLTPANAEYRMVGKGRFRRRLTQEEADRYSLETGKLYRQMVMNYGPRALQMPVERAKDYISAKADDMRDLALQRAVRN